MQSLPSLVAEDLDFGVSLQCHRQPDDTISNCSTESGSRDCDVEDKEGCQSPSSSVSDLGVETLILFDWDDTLFPTSWLQRQGLLVPKAVLSIDQRSRLDKLAGSAQATLRMALQIGKVIIVTNAEQGWIEQSCTRFMPSLIGLLKTVDIVSARSTYEKCVEDPAEWKRLAFQYEIDHFYGSSSAGQPRNIVSLGDSSYELNALKSTTVGVPNCCGKSIKLMEVPSVEQLIEEHEVIISCLPDVLEHNGDVDVEIGAEGVE